MLLEHKCRSAVEVGAAVGGGGLGAADERVDLDPEEGEDGGEQDRPEHDDGGRPVLATHETLRKGYKCMITHMAKNTLPKSGPQDS